MATEEETRVESPPKPGSSRAQLYTWQTWVHVGPGAENCEEVNEENGTVECSNPLHFHAWVRLPNPFQQIEIREKAQGAKARRMRLIRDEGSDAHAVLEEEMESLQRRGEVVRTRIVEELMQREWWRYVLDAGRDLAEERVDENDVESALKWEHIEDDRVKMLELGELPEGERPEDEIKMLAERVSAYDKALEDRRDVLAKPERTDLEALALDALVDRLRDFRIEREGSQSYQTAYAEQQMLTCTYRFAEGPEWFASTADLRHQPSDVISALVLAFSDLDREKGGVALGNS